VSQGSEAVRAAAPGAASGDVTVFEVEAALLGNLLGKAGNRVKAIRAESGAKVFIESKDIDPGRSLRKVTITGSEVERHTAHYLSVLALHNGAPVIGERIGRAPKHSIGVGWHRR